MFETWQCHPSQVRRLSREEADQGQMGGQTSWGSTSDQHGHSCVLHHKQLLLIASEAGIPLCVGVCQVWNGCTSPTPVKPTLGGSDSKTTPQEDNGLAIIQHQTRKTSLGWTNRKLHLLLWMSTGISTEDGWRFLVMCSRCGCLQWQNGWQDDMNLVEGWMSTPRCQWIADWTTTMTAHGAGVCLQDHWGMKWEGCSAMSSFSILDHHLPWWEILLLNPWGSPHHWWYGSLTSLA